MPAVTDILTSLGLSSDDAAGAADPLNKKPIRKRVPSATPVPTNEPRPTPVTAGDYQAPTPTAQQPVAPVEAKDIDPEWLDAVRESNARAWHVQHVAKPLEVAQAHFMKRPVNYEGMDEYTKEPMEQFKARVAARRAAQTTANEQQEQGIKSQTSLGEYEKASDEARKEKNLGTAAAGAGYIKPGQSIDKETAALLGKHEENESNRAAKVAESHDRAAERGLTRDLAQQKAQAEADQKAHEAGAKGAQTYEKESAPNSAGTEALPAVVGAAETGNVPGHSGLGGVLRKVGLTRLADTVSDGGVAKYQNSVDDMVRAVVAPADSNRPVSPAALDEYKKSHHLDGRATKEQERQGLQDLVKVFHARVNSQDTALTPETQAEMRRTGQKTTTQKEGRKVYEVSVHGHVVGHARATVDEDPQMIASQAKNKYGSDATISYKGMER